MKHILLVEDDKTISKNLILLLQSEDFLITHVPTQKEAIRLLSDHKFDLALIDISLPDGNGFTVCTEIKQTQKIPIIFLTASDEESSVVTGLSIGADDYITKPFRPRELIARMKTALRKNEPYPSTFEIHNLSVDTASGIVKKDNKELSLSALEYRLLLIFLNNPNYILTRDRLLHELWDLTGEFVTNNALTVYIKRLREKIEDIPAHPQIIQTIRGTGYRLGGSHVSK